MSASPPGLENNRFELLYQRWLNRPRKPGRWRRRIIAVFAGLIVVECLSLAAVFGWYWLRGVQSYRYLDEFFVTRYLVSPFVFKNPIKEYTKARYLGPNSNICVAAQWTLPDTLLGWRPAPSVGMLKQPYKVDNVTGWRFTNAQGFLSSGDYDYFYARPKPPGTFRVIVTGASSVEGDGAESPKQNLVSQFREQLEKDLAGKLPPGYERVEVINAGVGGYQSSQEYLYLISELVTYQPDLVVSYGGAVDIIRAWNDYDREGRVMDPIRTFRHDGDTRYLRGSFTILSPVTMFTSNVGRAVGCFVDELAMTYFIGRVYEKTEDVLRGALGTRKKALEARTQAPDYSIPVNAAVGSYGNSVKLMMKAAEIYNFRIAFLLQPAMSTDNKPLAAVEKEVFNSLSASEIKLRALYWDGARRMLAERAAQAGGDARFCFADVSRPFEGVQERVWDDTRHLLGAGNRIVAGQILDRLRACKQLPAR